MAQVRADGPRLNRSANKSAFYWESLVVHLLGRTGAAREINASIGADILNALESVLAHWTGRRALT